MNNPNPTKHSDEALRILTILKLDAEGVFERATSYFPEYVQILTLKRTREHIKETFHHKYHTIKVEDLKQCGQEVIVELSRFYDRVNRMKWYLTYTEDMPNTIQDKIKFDLRELERTYSNLSLYLEAEISGIKMQLHDGSLPAPVSGIDMEPLAKATPEATDGLPVLTLDVETDNKDPEL